jgi:hypothetical protein
MTDSPVSRRQALAGIGIALLAAVLPRSLGAHPLPRDPLPHPEPRDGITAANVLPESDLGASKAVHEAYAAARANPAIFDGLYCVCECEEMGHRSLLACFESKQATGCWSCREQAQLVARLVEKGQGLADIRKAFDEKWGKK